MIRSWEERTSWFRRFSARMGLQGKLILCFLFLLVLAMTASGMLFFSKGRALLRHMVGEQAVQISHTLAMASETPLAQREVAELDRIGRDVLKSLDVVTVAFYDAGGTLLSIASQDPDIDARHPGAYASGAPTAEGLLKVRHSSSRVLGRYATVTAPVVSVRHATPAAGPTLGATHVTTAPTKLVGYVTVCLGQSKDESRIDNVQALLLLIGACVVLVSLPVVYLLVYRIFMPIRQLVDAADRIAGGDLTARVAIHRPDVIGTLARSFNQMVIKVKQQQDDLAQANDQLERANHELERKVTERTAQLEAAAGQLAAANKRLSSEIAEKEDFLRAVSHDLNAPLRNISGMASMLLIKHRATFDQDVVHRLERIQKNVEVETDLISELLELSRIKTRRQKMEPVDLGKLVGELADVFENDLRERQIQLLVDTELPTLVGERARLRQVFQNLIDNAIKYMGDGSPAAGTTGPRLREIHVGCAVRPAGAEAEFYVRDTGIGIEPDDMDKVFCVFRRGKGQAVQGVSGKGVGLASVKSIVETYSGSIWVESAPNVGSTFRFTMNGKHLTDTGDTGGAQPPASPLAA